MRRGISFAEFDKAFLAAGGTIERDTSSHVLYKYAGLPTYGTHCNNTGAPGRLVSMLRKMEAGVVVSPEREVASMAIEESDVVDAVEERHRFVQKPNLRYDIAIASPHKPESVAEMIERMAAQKAADRDAALMRSASRIPTAPAAPYVSVEEPVVFPTNPDPKSLLHRVSPSTPSETAGCWRLFREAMNDDDLSDPTLRTVAFFESKEEWTLELMGMGWAPIGGVEASLARLRDKLGNPDWTPTEFVIVVARPKYGVPVDTVNVIPHLSDGKDAVAVLSTLNPGMYAKFRQSWQHGIDCARQDARRVKATVEEIEAAKKSARYAVAS